MAQVIHDKDKVTSSARSAFLLSYWWFLIQLYWTVFRLTGILPWKIRWMGGEDKNKAMDSFFRHLSSTDIWRVIKQLKNPGNTEFSYQWILEEFVFCITGTRKDGWEFGIYPIGILYPSAVGYWIKPGPSPWIQKI